MFSSRQVMHIPWRMSTRQSYDRELSHNEHSRCVLHNATLDYSVLSVRRTDPDQTIVPRAPSAIRMASTPGPPAVSQDTPCQAAGGLTRDLPADDHAHGTAVVVIVVAEVLPGGAAQQGDVQEPFN